MSKSDYLKNPIFFLFLITLFSSLGVDYSFRADSAYQFVVWMPFILVIPLAITLYILNINYKLIKFMDLTVKMCVLLLILLTAWNIKYTFFDIANFYGGMGGLISRIGDNNIVFDIQRNIGKSMSIFLMINYSFPVLLIPIVSSNRRLYLLVLYFSMAVLAIASFSCGTRVLFIDSFIAMLAYYFITRSFTYRNLAVLMSTIIILFLTIIFSQSIRVSQDTNNNGIKSIVNYYSVSLNQGANIVTSEITREPLYWTLRPLLTIPYISDISGIRGVFKELSGDIPILTREDEFTYASSVGGDPRFNTFGIYGYEFLDAGYFSVILIGFSYSIIFILFYYIKLGKPFAVLLYPVSISLIADQMRTNGIFSSRYFYFLIFAYFIYLFDKSLRGKEK